MLLQPYMISQIGYENGRVTCTHPINTHWRMWTEYLLKFNDKTESLCVSISCIWYFFKGPWRDMNMLLTFDISAWMWLFSIIEPDEYKLQLYNTVSFFLLKN